MRSHPHSLTLRIDTRGCSVFRATPVFLQFLQLCALSDDMIESIIFLSSMEIYRAYQKTMAIRNYFVIFLRSAITKLNKKTMAIDRNKSCITIIAAGSRQDRDDRGRIATIAAGGSEMK